MIDKIKYSLIVIIPALILAGVQLLPQENNEWAITNYELRTDNRYLSAVGQTTETNLANLSLVQGNTLRAYSSPGVIGDNSLSSRSYNYESQLMNYVVQSGDTVDSVAEQFGVSPKTILWANDLSSSESLKIGQKLTILPVTGALHLVQPGDSLSKIAHRYQADVDQIISFNQLPRNHQIYVGDLLIIPYGQKPKQAPMYRWSIADTFIIPAEGWITQTLHPYNAVDVANHCGTPVYAAASGKVQRTGWIYHGGRRVRILHSNGVVTYYGHLSQIFVSPGQHISQGQQIGTMGNSGYTLGPTGCHVHYDVRGARNNLAGYALRQHLDY